MHVCRLRSAPFPSQRDLCSFAGDKVAIEVDGPSHFIAKTQAERGEMLVRQLAEAGTEASQGVRLGGRLGALLPLV